MKALIFLFTFCQSLAFAETLIVEMKRPLNSTEIEKMKAEYHLQSMTLFAQADSEYFKRTYEVIGENLSTFVQSDFVQTAESITKAEIYSLIPAENSKFIGEDNLFHHQWGLLNQGQTIIKTIKTTKNQKIIGTVGTDIGWSESIDQYEENLKKTPLVAVIDMGIDLDHPDLKDQIFVNTKECPDGVISDADEDKDNNGLKGDCKGWNFAAKSAYEARRPYDDKSHGTHVSGIIAAKANKIGVRGVSDKIKILPLKVTGRIDEYEDKRSIQPLTDRVAKALIYATNMKADIINLSMGWTKSMDTKYLREALNYSLSKGVLIVAAAGNNNTKATILPCSSYDILCVGALTIDGNVAAFSNFGAEVDILAPGDEIMSTIPMDSIPLQINQNGYDIKSGTSQATPFVSAIAALLKGINPDYTRDDLIRILTSTAEPSRNKTLSLNGLVRMDRALNYIQTTNVKPIFKNLSNLSFDHQSKRFGFLFNVKNYGEKVEGIKVTIESLTNSIELNNQTLIEKLNISEVSTLKIDGRILDPRADQKIPIKVTIEYNDKTEVYFHDFILSRDILKDKNIKIKNFAFVDKPLPVGVIKDGNINNIISTIDDVFPRTHPHYIMVKINDELKQLEAKVLVLKGEQVEELKKTIIIKNATQFLNVMRLDLNLDGSDDYLLRTIVCTEKCDNKKEAVRHIQYNLFNSELEDLIPNASSWKFLPNIVNVNMETLKLVPTDTVIGKVAIPYFIEKGKLPDSQQMDNYFTAKDTRVMNRLYRLMPEMINNEVVLKTESVLLTQDIDQIKNEYKHKKNETENILFSLSQTEVDYKNSKADFFLSIGNGYLQKNYVLTLQNSSFKVLPSTISKVLTGFTHEDTISLNQERHQDAFVGFLTNSRMNVEFHKGKSLYIADQSVEVPLSHIASFNLDNEYFSFIQTPNYLKLINKNKVLEKRINRFSFLPGHIFNETFYPIVSKVDGVNKPSLYVDASDISTNLMSVTTVLDQELVTPLEFSVFIPPICRAMNPYPLEGEMSFTLLCLENKNWSLRFLPIII